MKNRADIATTIAIVALIVAGRAAVLWGAGGVPHVPLGPDADDWFLATRSYLEGQPSLILSFRYPLLPWLAAWIVRGTGLGIADALLIPTVLSSALGAAVLWSIARRFLPWTLAAGVLLWMALGPPEILLSIWATAYPLFTLGFLLLLRALVDERERGSRAMAALAAVGAFLCTASLWQGAWGALVLLPVALLYRRWGAAATTLAGVVLAVGFVLLAHPQADPPIVGFAMSMLGYVPDHVGGQVTEAGGRYAHKFWEQATMGFGLGRGPLGALLLAGAAGLVVSLVRGGPTSSPGPTYPPRIRCLALTWVVLPLFGLLLILDSGHHQAHLRPLLVVAAFMGLHHLLGERRWAHALPVLLLGAALVPRLRWISGYLEGTARQSRMQVQLAEQVTGGLESRLLLLVVQHPGVQGMRAMEMCEWALPPQVRVIRVLSEAQNVWDLAELERDPMPVMVATTGTEQAWDWGPWHVACLGPQRALPYPPVPEVTMLCEARVERDPDYPGPTLPPVGRAPGSGGAPAP